MKKIKIDKTDPFRVLLTEVLPYETPFFFSNEGFYRFCRNELNTCPEIIKRILAGWKNDVNPREISELLTIPYNYEIRKNNIETRTLSLMHPAAQLRVVDLYRDFSPLILHLCQRSYFSLRYPAGIASEYYEGNENIPEDELKYCSNYFEYEKYPFLYRFFHSYEFLQLEKRFHHLKTFDISKCFAHIYTHTISWAVRNKEFSKAQINHRSFDRDFDQLMQSANHRETAGILIGPEVSRIFAEIILQRIDSVVEKKAKSAGFLVGTQYDVRRYVDDYYLFAVSKDIADKVLKIYLSELKNFKQYLNESKTEDFTVPFMTEISCAKVAISNVLNEFFHPLFNDLEQLGTTPALFTIKLTNIEAKARRLLQKIKAIVKSDNVDFSSISIYIFAVMGKRLKALLKALPDAVQQGNSVGKLLYAFLDIYFFVYAMDIRVPTTYRIINSIIDILSTAKNMDISIIDALKKKIHDEALRILDSELTQNPVLYMETINLLAVIRLLGNEYRLDDKIISKFVDHIAVETKDIDGTGIQYFLIIGVLFYIGNDDIYTAQKERLIEIVFQKYLKATNHYYHADFVCLLFDLLSCPFLPDTYKTRLLTIVRVAEGKGNRLLSDREKISMHHVASARIWFSDWNARDNVEVLMERKKYRTPY